MAITPALPAIVFLVLALGGILGGWLWRGALHKRYGKMTYLSIFRIDTLRRMKRLGWFELYETKDVSRLVFSKNRFAKGCIPAQADTVPRTNLPKRLNLQKNRAKMPDFV